jgi:putative transposase
MLTKFTIPVYSNIRYPIINKLNPIQNSNSWFDTNLIKNNFIPIISKDKILRCKEILVKPNKIQREILLEWFNLYRYTYNQTVKYLRCNANNSFYTLRPIIKNNFPNEIKSRIQSCKVPAHTLDNAIHDVLKAIKSSIALHKGRKKFRIRYKKENADQTITIERQSFSKKNNSFSTKLGIIETSSDIKNINHDCKLSLRSGKFILFRPVDTNKKTVQTKISCCSLDPGLRTFQTIYSNNGEFFTVGNNFISKIKPLLAKLEYDSKPKYKKRLRDRIKHLVDDLHWKTANNLCKFSNRILIGKMSTVGILQGNLNSENKRLIQSAAHFTFRQRLKAKCEEYGTELIEVNESYTSKTCGSCGRINQKLKASKIFNCDCGFNIDRDYNGARNIMIKFLQ